MPDLLIHVARDDAKLGAFTPDEVRELLDTGFLKPGDLAWIRGMNEWAPLSTTLPHVMAQSNQPDWRDSVVAGSTALSRVVGRQVGQFVAKVRAQARDGKGVLSQAKKMALEQHLPQLHKLLAERLRDKPADLAQQALRSDEMMQSLAHGLYQCLPRALRRVVPASAFVGFCLEHRRKLLNAPGPEGPPPLAKGTTTPDPPPA